MRDLFLDGLPILDALEIGATTATAARWLNCDQSSISRTYRRASDQLGLNFQKTNGTYNASGNLALLESLRQASQLRRLSSQGQLLQWLLHPELQPRAPLSALTPPPKPPLACDWPEPERLVELLRRHIVDLALIPLELAAALNTHRSAPVTVLTLQTAADAAERRLSAVVRRDLQNQPCIEQLLGQLSTVFG